MSIASEIARLQQAKADLKTAINNKGGNITNEKIDQYAGFVDGLSTGSEGIEGTEGLLYQLSNDGTYYICLNIGTATDVEHIVIPEFHNGLPVKEIGNGSGWFAGIQYPNTNNVIKSIVIPKTVRILKSQCFRGLTALQRLIFAPESELETIEAYILADSPVKTFILPKNVISVHEDAFWRTSIRDFIFETPTQITTCKFLEGTDSKTLIVPSGITELYISDNYSLVYLDLPSTITKITSSGSSIRYMYDFRCVICRAATPPTLERNYTFHDLKNNNGLIFVPQSSVNAYKTAPKWNEYADYIMGY